MNMTSRCSLLPVVTSVVSVTWLQVGILLDLCSVVTTGLNHGESQSNKQKKNICTQCNNSRSGLFWLFGTLWGF